MHAINHENIIKRTNPISTDDFSVIVVFIMLSISHFYVQIQTQNQHMLLHLKLQAELQRTLQLIGKDLRRLGFRALNTKGQKAIYLLFELDEQGTAISLVKKITPHLIAACCSFMI